MKKSTDQIIVIGSGVNGLSTAHLLLEAGYKVKIISKHDPKHAISDPAFSSLYPSASILPHSVYSNDVENLFRKSMEIFSQLYDWKFPGLTVHEHFELFCQKETPPWYAGYFDKFEEYPDFKESWHPSHPSEDIVTGWKLNCFFADWEVYYPYLLNTYLDKKGELEIRELSSKDLSSLDSDVIINCSGLGSIELFMDPHTRVQAGHLLKIAGTPILRNPQNTRISYNFTLGEGYYSNSFGEPMDVYCYPRQDGWVLGGSRIEGVFSSEKGFKGEDYNENTYLYNGIQVPAPIQDLNLQIIEHTFDIIPKARARKAAVLGYRYTRSAESGLRIETEEKFDKLIIHNYGHGGSGVTLSWGCASRVLELLKEHA